MDARAPTKILRAGIQRLVVATLLGVAFAVGLAVMTVGPAHPAPLLSQEQARAKAVTVLRGDPYGKTNAEVMGNIKQTEFLRDGVTRPCGAMKKPVWQFHVVVSAADRHIDGYLILDAQSGEMLCHNLPFLD